MNQQQGAEQTAQQPPPPPPPTPTSQAILAAIEVTRRKHPADFDILQPSMAIVLRVLYPSGLCPDWSQLTAEDLIESLYVIVRYASFAEATRRIAFAQAQQNQPSGVM